MNVEHPASLADVIRALVVNARGSEFQVDAISSLGGWQRIADDATTLIDDPLLLPLVSLVIRDAKAGGTAATMALEALSTAVLSTRNPGVFGDALGILAASPAALEAVGGFLADNLLTHLSDFLDVVGPDNAAVSRAADALETLTRLKVGGSGTPFGLFAFLERFRSPAPARLATAAIRSVGTAVDHWPEALSLKDVVMVLAGMMPAQNATDPRADPEDIGSDASWVLSGIDLVHALRTDDLAEMGGSLCRPATT